MTHHTSLRLQKFSVLCLAVILTILLVLPAGAAYPKHTDYISDPSGILSENTRQTILSSNETLFRDREVRIAVCLTDSTGDEDIAAFSHSLFYEWDMCDGVLLVLDTTAQTYFAVPSVDVDDIVTNTVLADVLDQYMEPDFAAGNIDSGVSKTVVYLAQFMNASLPAPGAETADAEEDAAGGEETEEDKPSGFVTFMKVILWIIIIAVILAAGIFVLALFNEDVGDFVRTYVFRRGPAQPVSRPEYYDDRLYGSGQPQRRNPNNPYRQDPYGQRRPQYPQNGQYRQPAQRQQTYDPYNDYDMQYQQPRQGQPRSQGQYRGQGQYQGQGYNQNYNQGYPNQGYGQRQPQGQNRQNGQNRTYRNPDNRNT